MQRKKFSSRNSTSNDATRSTTRATLDNNNAAQLNRQGRRRTNATSTIGNKSGQSLLPSNYHNHDNYEDSLISKRRRKKRLKQKKNKCTQFIETVMLIIVFVGIAGLFFLVSFYLVYSIQTVSDPHSFLRKQRYAPPEMIHYDLYEKTFITYNTESNLSNSMINDNKSYTVNKENNSLIKTDFLQKIDLSSYGATFIDTKSSNQCDITVVIMDPRIPDNPPGSPIFYTLESIALYIPKSCVLIQTSKCFTDHHKDGKDYLSSFQKTTISNRSEKGIYQSIYQSSFPMFQSMIENGQVRVSFLNHEKYQLQGCKNFYNPSKALMNYHYWNDEFVHVDSDLVLFMQSDSIICHSMDIDQYRQFAFVGATWPKVSNLYHTDFCVSMPIWWKTWTLPQRQWEKFLSVTTGDLNGNGNPSSKMYPKPDVLLDSLDFPDICHNDEGTIAPVGNGGLSLRSRKYMMKAIETCPHTKYSGLINTAVAAGGTTKRNFACQVVDPINEDLYFGVVLRGIKAPLPSGFEAALFSLEMLWPEQTIDLYGGPESFRGQKNVASRFWGTSSSSFASSAVYEGVHHKGKYYTVPVGMHKPWEYQSMDVLHTNDVLNQCPLLLFITPPAKYENKTKESDE